MRDALVLEPLVDRLLAAAALPVQGERKRLWADHQALRPTPRIPVCVYYEGIPEPQWEAMLGPEALRCRGALARSIEGDLRRTLWMSDNVPDDHIVWPSIIVEAVKSRDEGWGVPLAWAGTRPGVDDPLEARRIVPPLRDGIDIAGRPRSFEAQLGRLAFSDVEADTGATAARVEEARELVGGRLAVHVKWPDLGHSPFDIAARLCGLEDLLMWCADCPDRVAELVAFLAESHAAHHERRAREGRLNCFREGEYARVGFRVHCWRPGAPAAPGLAEEWAYVSAQTSSGLGPRQYEKLVEPSNRLLAAPFTRQTVYYHGCESLDGKIDSIARIPNLRRFHVSPWSSVEAAKRRFAGSVVCEVHSNPSEVFFAATRDDLRRGLRRLVEAGEGIPMDLNLSDIHSVNRRPEQLASWAREAREAGAGQRSVPQ